VGGDLIVRLKVDADVRPVLNLRVVRAVAGELYVEGMQIPMNALYQQEGQMGVVIAEQGGYFVPVNVLSSNSRTAIVEPVKAGGLRVGQKVRLF
jgi:hypothetical protein